MRDQAPSNQRGMTTVELITVMAVAGLLVAATSVFSLPWLARERMHGAVYEIQTAVQLARVRAVALNRECRLTLDTTSRSVAVWDTLGTGGLADDELLHQAVLSSAVTFARPDSGAAVTLEAFGGTQYQSRFGSSGVVEAGTGEVVLFGGDAYGRLTLYGAGGTRVERWNGSAWVDGL